MFSWRIDLGDVVTCAAVAVAGISFFQRMDYRVADLEKSQVQQAATNNDLRKEIREVADVISSKMDSNAAAVRRIEDKINRARL